ncbi:MAG: phage terminase large subunit [Nanoarchaeota archaeon]
MNPLKYAKSHPKQKEFFNSTKPIRVLFWGNRVGKTEGCAQEVVRYVLGEKVGVYIPIEVWCACPSYDSQKETTQKKLEKYIPKKEIKHITYIKAGTWGEIELNNGSKINFKSYEQGREKFQGAGKKLIWFDEEPPKDIWEECVVRQEAGQQLDIIMSMTPIKGMTWVYDDLFMQTGRSDLYISTASWDDNPWLTEKQKELMSINLSDEAIQVRRFGQFVKRVGLVCSWWDREKNLMEYKSTPAYDYYEVLDGGFSDPAAWLLIGLDGDGDLHVVDGFREKGLSDGEIVSRRNQKTAGLRIINGWLDYPDERLQENLFKLGMKLERVEKQVGDTQGWDEIVAEKLASYGKIQRGTGKPRLFINHRLDWLVQEIENLTWLEIKRQTDSGIQIMPKWDDHRRFGHHFDGLRALGYFVTSFDKPQDRNQLSSVVRTNVNMTKKWSI